MLDRYKSPKDCSQLLLRRVLQSANKNDDKKLLYPGDCMTANSVLSCESALCTTSETHNHLRPSSQQILRRALMQPAINMRRFKSRHNKITQDLR